MSRKDRRPADSPPLPPPGDAAAAAAYYRACREAGTWEAWQGCFLLRMQGERMDELVRLMNAIDAELDGQPLVLPPVPPLDDPEAAAAYYHWRRSEGTWHPEEAEMLYMSQSTDENWRELTRLLQEIDAGIDGSK